MVVTSSSARIIEDVDRSLEAFLIVLRAKGSAVKGTVNINGHIRKRYVKVEVSFWEVHEPKVRATSAN